MTFEDAIAIFGRREKCFMKVKGHNADAKYVVSRNNHYETSCGDHLTRAISQLTTQYASPGRIDVTVWVKP